MFDRFQNVNISITDHSFLRTIPLANVDAFLRSRGWKVSAEENLMLYHDPISRRTIELSHNDDFDYSGRLQAALETMQEVFQYNQLVLVEKILGTQSW
ncbi:hypothetical protein [Alicyclobacillus fastidiosus]|uniref:Uncharacterized protein n=1 Tax=Alicyclobacillus fastidiosus TaxID=392011 RepID=A0ABV5AAK9_9BACL|nr:hypothetical protein [Alicyclobacillus fastidiosus]WEH07729.1 hypothetical protein PYS47_13200 [Alicyclobacillus fastidiosus]